MKTALAPSPLSVGRCSLRKLPAGCAGTPIYCGSWNAAGRRDLSDEIAFSTRPCRSPAAATAADRCGNQMEMHMLFIVSLNWTDQGIRNVKDGPKRAQAARDMGKKLGVEIKELYLTSGDTDMVAILETPNGDNVAKFAMAIGSQGNIRTRTARAWTQAEMQKMISELP
jgi:uncharacterized protein with GYD domain